MKRILVVYTGGTIGMVSTPSGYAPEKKAFHELLDRIPELHAEGMPKWKTFVYGTLSGVIEPVGALLTAFAAGLFLPVIPFLLAFAAGSMFYVVVEELVPDMARGEHGNEGTLCFAAGFVIMMALDIAFS